MQIACTPRAQFLAEWEQLFPGEQELASSVYRNALSRRAFLTLHYVRRKQGAEPHYQATRFR
jgi:hypothetical protein